MKALATAFLAFLLMSCGCQDSTPEEETQPEPQVKEVQTNTLVQNS